jgi:hypothetical protein
LEEEMSGAVEKVVAEAGCEGGHEGGSKSGCRNQSAMQTVCKGLKEREISHRGNGHRVHQLGVKVSEALGDFPSNVAGASGM